MFTLGKGKEEGGEKFLSTVPWFKECSIPSVSCPTEWEGSGGKVEETGEEEGEEEEREREREEGGLKVEEK